MFALHQQIEGCGQVRPSEKCLKPLIFFVAIGDSQF
jgi:hypothetical protein